MDRLMVELCLIFVFGCVVLRMAGEVIWVAATFILWRAATRFGRRYSYPPTPGFLEYYDRLA
jgi:hypothetical protein